MYTALYRAYRPEVFDEILGQDHIVRILKNQINTDTTTHAYLFCGTRGTGKTTTARILAKGLNCLSEGERPCGQCSACRAIKEGTFIDVIEIDAASNNSVDNIRELRESVKYPPAAGRKKVYIIDEVHMLSTGAFNALLKTLEEPPEYVVFILATTDPNKLPATILSRCLRLDFKRVPEKIMIDGMAGICREVGVEVSDSALRIIAANADGSVRDGLSILDQCISGGDKQVTAADVLEFLGASGEETFVELTDLVRSKRTTDAIVLVAQALADGKDVRQFMHDWLNHYRNLLMTKFMKNPQEIINMSVENIDRIRRQSESLELSEINRGILEISRMINEIRWSTQPRILLEVLIVRLSSAAAHTSAVELADDRILSESKPQTVPQASSPKAQQQPLQDEALSLGADEPPQSEQAAQGDDRNTAGGAAQHGNTHADEDAPEHIDDDSRSAEFSKEECEKIWRAVFEEGEASKGSFYLIARCADLAAIDENSFTVAVRSGHIKAHAERNRELLEALMARHTGKQRIMHITEAQAEPSAAASTNIEDIAKEAEKLLGVNVEIK